MTTEELVNDLALEAEWASANIWEVPILLPDHLMEAAHRLVSLESELKACRKELCRKCGKTDCGVCRWKEANKAVPATDAVEVVRHGKMKGAA